MPVVFSYFVSMKSRPPLALSYFVTLPVPSFFSGTDIQVTQASQGFLCASFSHWILARTAKKDMQIHQKMKAPSTVDYVTLGGKAGRGRRVDRHLSPHEESPRQTPRPFPSGGTKLVAQVSQGLQLQGIRTPKAADRPEARNNGLLSDPAPLTGPRRRAGGWEIFGCRSALLRPRVADEFSQLVLARRGRGHESLRVSLDAPLWAVWTKVLQSLVFGATTAETMWRTGGHQEVCLDTR